VGQMATTDRASVTFVGLGEAHRRPCVVLVRYRLVHPVVPACSVSTPKRVQRAVEQHPWLGVPRRLPFLGSDRGRIDRLRGRLDDRCRLAAPARTSVGVATLSA